MLMKFISMKVDKKWHLFMWNNQGMRAVQSETDEIFTVLRQSFL